MVTLALDASTYAGSVAILIGNEVASEKVIGETAGPVRGSRDEAMMPAIADCLRSAQIESPSLDRIVCGEGPGSFTSLRIAVSLAKGLAHSLDIPLYSVSSLRLFAAGAGTERRVITAINAMRGESFAAEFELDDTNVIEVGPPRILDDSTLAGVASDRKAILLRAEAGGTGPRARSVSRILESIISSGPVDLAGWEPTYGRLAEAQVRWEKESGKSLGR